MRVWQVDSLDGLRRRHLLLAGGFPPFLARRSGGPLVWWPAWARSVLTKPARQSIERALALDAHSLYQTARMGRVACLAQTCVPLALIAWVTSGAASAQLDPPLLADDFETGTLLPTENPPGRWSNYTIGGRLHPAHGHSPRLRRRRPRGGAVRGGGEPHLHGPRRRAAPHQRVRGPDDLGHPPRRYQQHRGLSEGLLRGSSHGDRYPPRLPPCHDAPGCRRGCPPERGRTLDRHLRDGRGCLRRPGAPARRLRLQRGNGRRPSRRHRAHTPDPHSVSEPRRCEAPLHHRKGPTFRLAGRLGKLPSRAARLRLKGTFPCRSYVT